mmetsp:Transcript_31600/g.48319  ORF Transcript_31600/g.48319 Transcript_31600/m.48319 type:complete len:118 (+) Transcript_31600:439-792(+)
MTQNGTKPGRPGWGDVAMPFNQTHPFGCQNGRKGFLEADPLFKTQGCSCKNPFEKEEDQRKPMPNNCQVFQPTDSCHRFEMTEDRKVKSCQKEDKCEDNKKKAESKCVKFHEKKNQF